MKSNKQIILISESDKKVFEQKVSEYINRIVNMSNFSTTTFKNENGEDCIMYSTILLVE